MAISRPPEAARPGTKPSSAVERPHPAWWIAILSGMSLVTLLACSDRAYAIFVEHTGGFLTRPVIQGIFIVAWALHIGEALYARRLAGELKLSAAQRRGYTLQTFLLGFPSLSKLLQRRQAAR